RPYFKRSSYGTSSGKINISRLDQHVIIFEEDLCQLIKRLKQLVYLNIYGRIRYEKVESYRLMVQRRFPNSRFDIEISRFRLWR
ncbi:unnamed protein product, partial [Rotaria sp. Silwood1]